MSIYMAITLFSFIILLYWIITEAFTLLFRMTGLPDERARFQVTSLLTGCGYTTKESEMFLSSRSRRRLVRMTMLFGYVFNITVVTALINVFFFSAGQRDRQLFPQPAHPPGGGGGDFHLHPRPRRARLGRQAFEPSF